MTKNQENLFSSSFGVMLNSRQVVRAIMDFMALDTKRRYKVIIGTDSQKYAGNVTDFVTAIVVHRVGNGGRYFWRRFTSGRKFHTLRDRILEEVMMSLETAKLFLTASRELSAPEFDFEIHVDVGENGESKVMIFEAKTKPESYAASKVADRHV